jgi:hypothetical protein
MADRTTTLTSTVLATVLTGTGLMSAGYAPARAADDCLRAPNQTSAGGHWYYRIDRQSQRKCWYLADEGDKTDQVPSAKAPPSAKKIVRNTQRATEKIQRSNADARAELPPLTHTDPPGHANAPETPYAEPFMDGPRRTAPEAPVPPGGNALLNSAPPGDSEPATTNAVKDTSTDSAKVVTADAVKDVSPDAAAKDVSAEAAAQDASTGAVPEALPTAANHEPVVQLPADETAISPFRLMLSLLLVATGLAAVMAGVIFRRSDRVSARRDDVPFHMRNTDGEPEEALEEMASLALTEDVPLFLVNGRPGPDQWSRSGSSSQSA